MDTRRAMCESFVRFLDFKRAFNHQFKVSVAALMHVSRIVSGHGGTRIMQGLVSDTNEPWTQDFNWTHPSQDLQDALVNTTLLGILQVHSAIDDFCDGLTADYVRWLDFARRTPAPREEEDQIDAERLEITAGRFGWPTDEFAQWRPVLRYFRSTRNCIAHRSGIASPTFVDASSSPELATALASWPKRDGGNPPTPPQFALGQRITLLPRHAILGLDAAYRASDYLNRQFIKNVGADGLSYLAAHHSLLHGRVTAIPYRSAQSVVADALANRYHVRGVTAPGVIPVLKGLGVWKNCLKEFERR